MSSVPSAIRALVSGVSGFDEVLRDLDADWSPADVPLTIAMSDIGRVLAAHAGTFAKADIVLVLERVEIILREGSDDERDAVATGFLEAVASGLDTAREHKWIVEHAGPLSRQYLNDWNQFTGNW